MSKSKYDPTTMFNYDELMITLTAFAMWLRNKKFQHNAAVIDLLDASESPNWPKDLVDLFIKETVLEDEGSQQNLLPGGQPAASPVVPGTTYQERYIKAVKDDDFE